MTDAIPLFGSFPGLSLTGEIRTPLRATNGKNSKVVVWVLVVIARPLSKPNLGAVLGLYLPALG